jgi:hypothetical protein
MSDDLVKRLLDFDKVTVGDARDAALRIEALTAKVKLMDDLDVINGEKIEALTEQLEAARADAKEAEAYAEELERGLKTCRMAQAVMENTVAEVVEERDHWQDVAGREGVCMTCRGPRGAPEPYGCSDCFNTGYCGEWHNEMHELREELAKAVEALRAFKAFDDMPTKYKRPDVFEMSVRRKLLATLAEIEGEKG